MDTFDPNTEESIFAAKGSEIAWVKKDTAILVVHGMGNQLPLETLDQFGRGLIKSFKKEFDEEIKKGRNKTN